MRGSCPHKVLRNHLHNFAYLRSEPLNEPLGLEVVGRPAPCSPLAARPCGGCARPQAGRAPQCVRVWSSRRLHWVVTPGSRSQIHLISLEWSREPVVPRPASCTLGIWGLRTAELHGSQFRSPVFFRGSAIPAPSTSAPPPPAPLMFWPQSCPRPVDLSGLCLDSFAPSAPTPPAWEPLD